MSWLTRLFSDPPRPPFKKGVYIERLIIEAFSSDQPDGSAQGERPNVAGVMRISATKDSSGKIWLDGWQTPSGHELQHLCASEDPEFAQPDNNIIR